MLWAEGASKEKGSPGSSLKPMEGCWPWRKDGVWLGRGPREDKCGMVSGKTPEQRGFVSNVDYFPLTIVLCLKL